MDECVDYGIVCTKQTVFFKVSQLYHAYHTLTQVLVLVSGIKLYPQKVYSKYGNQILLISLIHYTKVSVP